MKKHVGFKVRKSLVASKENGASVPISRRELGEHRAIVTF